MVPLCNWKAHYSEQSRGKYLMKNLLSRLPNIEQGRIVVSLASARPCFASSDNISCVHCRPPRRHSVYPLLHTLCVRCFVWVSFAGFISPLCLPLPSQKSVPKNSAGTPSHVYSLFAPRRLLHVCLSSFICTHWHTVTHVQPEGLMYHLFLFFSQWPDWPQLGLCRLVFLPPQQSQYWI